MGMATRRIAIGAGACPTLRVEPFNAWPFCSCRSRSWLADRWRGAGRRRGVPARLAGWWAGSGDFVPGLYGSRRVPVDAQTLRTGDAVRRLGLRPYMAMFTALALRLARMTLVTGDAQGW